MKDIELWYGDCLDLLDKVPQNSARFVFCDLPYAHSRKGKVEKCTENKWDTPIDLARFWDAIERICLPNAAIACTAKMKFAHALLESSTLPFRYDFSWHKTRATNFLNAAQMPLVKHENVLIFYKRQPVYNPQMSHGKPYKSSRRDMSTDHNWGNRTSRKKLHTIDNSGQRFPTSILSFNETVFKKTLHPTQKPLELLRYLTNTYSNRGDLIVDPTAGSMGLAVAAHETGRRAICIEKDPEYYRRGVDRVTKAMAEPRQEVML